MASQLTLILEYYKWLLSSQFKHVILLCTFVFFNTDIKEKDVIFFFYKIEIIFLKNSMP